LVRWLDRTETDGAFSLENLRTYLTELEKVENLRPRSIRSVQGALRAFGTWLVDTAAIETNVARFIKRPRMDEPIVRSASESEARALLDGCDRLKVPSRGILAKAVLSVLLFAGLRRSELLTLEVGDIDLADRRLLVRAGKGHKTRSIPINADLLAALSDWFAIRPCQYPLRRADRQRHARTNLPAAACVQTDVCDDDAA